VARAIRRFSVLSGVTLCAVLVGPIAAAQASNNTLRATLNSYSAKIVKDENAVKNGLAGYPQGKVKPLIHALTTEIRDLHALRTKLADDSASSAEGATAKSEIVTRSWRGGASRPGRRRGGDRPEGSDQAPGRTESAEARRLISGRRRRRGCTYRWCGFARPFRMTRRRS
jgi:hypothetical protein